MTQLDYASSPEFHTAVSRARWAVIQTGLITSGLALFGVYVLATRINDLHLMNLYVFERFPAGPLLVGLICGSGYILAAWWFGVRVGAGMIAGIVALQLTMFMACHYADFETLDLVYRDTGKRVGFFTYFHYTTGRLGVSTDPAAVPPEAPPVARGYLIRAAEAACFAAGGLLAAFMLVGRPQCGLCGGLVRRRSLGRVCGARERLRRLEDRARVGDARAFAEEIASHDDRNPAEDGPALELFILRCEVCGVGAVESAEIAETAGTAARGIPRPVASEHGSPAPSASSRTASSSDDSGWRVNLRAEMARQLFEQKPRPRPRATEAVG